MKDIHCQLPQVQEEKKNIFFIYVRCTVDEFDVL